MTHFDNIQIIYEESIHFHSKRAKDKGASYPLEIAELIEASADVYEAICADLSPDDMKKWAISDDDQAETQGS